MFTIWLSTNNSVYFVNHFFVNKYPELSPTKISDFKLDCFFQVQSLSIDSNQARECLYCVLTNVAIKKVHLYFFELKALLVHEDFYEGKKIQFYKII